MDTTKDKIPEKPQLENPQPEKPLLETIISNITNGIKNKLSSIASKLSNNSSNDENVLDINKTFSSESIDVSAIIKHILALPTEFPHNILNSKAGHKFNELEFFQSNQDSNGTNNTQTNANSLFEKFNRTSTQLGKTLLQSIILEPTLDIDNILKHRQSIINTFAKHKELLQIRKTLETCSKLEKDILAMQMADTPEMEEVYKVVFFQFLPLQKLNYNELFLKLFYYFIIIFSPAYGVVAPFVFMFAPFIFMRYILKIPLSFDAFWGITKNMILGGTGFFTNLNKILNSGLGKAATAMVGGGCDDDKNGESNFSIKRMIISLAKWVVGFMCSSAGTYIYLGFMVFTYLYGIYNSTQVSITYNKIINMFHSRLNIISKWLKGAIEFYNMGLGFEFPELSGIIGEIKNLLDSKNPTVISLLSSSTFNDEPGLFSNKGIIIKTFKEFLDMKHLLLPFSKYMAHIDVWSSIGVWMQGGGLGGNRSLCNFIKGSQAPIVKGANVWNICCNVPVYNDVGLGGDAACISIDAGGVDGAGYAEDAGNTRDTKYNNLLITGPNGAGKSTYIKSVIECILLGQTVGVVPAKVFEFTPFKNIATYLNIPDCQGKESLFQAEMNRCYQQLQMLGEAEKQGDFSFNIMDEIFVSTNYQEGMSGAYAIIKKMCKLSKCLNIITTHFDVLAGMDEVQVSKKYFDIEIDENDNFKGDYKIRDGVSKKHMALKLLKKKGFDASIIEDAEYLYNKLQKQDISREQDIAREQDISREQDLKNPVRKPIITISQDNVKSQALAIESIVKEKQMQVDDTDKIEIIENATLANEALATESLDTDKGARGAEALDTEALVN
jgi:hypothetical protein